MKTLYDGTIIINGTEYGWRNFTNIDPDESGQDFYKDGKYECSIISNRFIDAEDDDDMRFLATEIRKFIYDENV